MTFDDRVRAALDRAAADVCAAAAAEIDEVTRSAGLAASELSGALSDLAAALASLDNARSFRSVLVALAEHGRHEPVRAVVFLVRNDSLVPYHPPVLDQSAGQIPLALAAVRTAAPAVERRAGRDAAAFPVIVGGSVVAVLWAASAASAAFNRWTATLGILARHAGCVLEAMTLRRLVGLESPADPVGTS